jgi:hypothetical protein
MAANYDETEPSLLAYKSIFTGHIRELLYLFLAIYFFT